MNTSGFNLNIGKVCVRLKDRAYCPMCEKLVRLLSFSDAAAIFRTDVNDIEKLGINGRLHRLHDRRAKLMICTDSVFSHLDRMQTRRLDSTSIGPQIKKAAEM
jgi:hypothetical protein